MRKTTQAKTQNNKNNNKHTQKQACRPKYSWSLQPNLPQGRPLRFPFFKMLLAPGLGLTARSVRLGEDPTKTWLLQAAARWCTVLQTAATVPGSTACRAVAGRNYIGVGFEPRWHQGPSMCQSVPTGHSFTVQWQRAVRQPRRFGSNRNRFQKRWLRAKTGRWRSSPSGHWLPEEAGPRNLPQQPLMTQTSIAWSTSRSP